MQQREEAMKGIDSIEPLGKDQLKQIKGGSSDTPPPPSTGAGTTGDPPGDDKDS